MLARAGSTCDLRTVDASLHAQHGCARPRSTTEGSRSDARVDVPLPADTSAWAFEPKWDGLRALCSVEAGAVRLVSRNGRDLTSDYPELHDLGACFGPTQALVDGEVIAFDAGGRPDFGSLQPRMHVADLASARHLAATDPVTYVVFDLLQLDGRSLLDLPYDTRRNLLAQLDLHGPHLSTSPSWTDTGSRPCSERPPGSGSRGSSPRSARLLRAGITFARLAQGQAPLRPGGRRRRLDGRTRGAHR